MEDLSKARALLAAILQMAMNRTFVLLQDPNELKRVTRVKPIDTFSAKWNSIVERILNRSQPTTNGVPSAGASSAPPSSASRKLR